MHTLDLLTCITLFSTILVGQARVAQHPVTSALSNASIDCLHDHHGIYIPSQPPLVAAANIDLCNRCAFFTAVSYPIWIVHAGLHVTQRRVISPLRRRQRLRHRQPRHLRHTLNITPYLLQPWQTASRALRDMKLRSLLRPQPHSNLPHLVRNSNKHRPARVATCYRLAPHS